MEGLKRVAVNSYNNWSEDEQKKANAFFRRIDDNNDSKVTFKELKDIGLITNKEFKVFDNFDMDVDGTLGFEEIVSLYFYKNKTSDFIKQYRPGHNGLHRRLKCNRCDVKQKLPDYSCFFCLEKGRKMSYNLCKNCYSLEYGGDKLKNQHQHEQWCLLSKESLGMLGVLYSTVLNEVEMKEEHEKNKDRFKNTEVAMGMVGTSTKMAGICTMQ